RIGKEHIYILELNENQLHEDDAAIALGDLICGKGIYYTKPKEGKINIMPKYKGLLKINRELLDLINDLGNICIATIHSNRYVDKEQLIGGCRIIPLTIEKEKILEIKNILKEKGPIFEIKSFEKFKTALIITGSEVYKGRIEDKFGPVIERKLK